MVPSVAYRAFGDGRAEGLADWYVGRETRLQFELGFCLLGGYGITVEMNHAAHACQTLAGILPAGPRRSAGEIDDLPAELGRICGTGPGHQQNTSRERVRGVHRTGAILIPQRIGSPQARKPEMGVGTGPYLAAGHPREGEFGTTDPGKDIGQGRWCPNLNVAQPSKRTNANVRRLLTPLMS